MSIMDLALNETWLNGKYPDIDAEIDTAHSTVQIGEYYWQGHAAEAVIASIHTIWLKSGDISVQQAIELYEYHYLG